MNYEVWHKDMLAKGYQNFFLGDLAKGSIALFAECFKNIANNINSGAEILLEEAHELKGHAMKYCLKKLLVPIEELEESINANDVEGIKKQIKAMVVIIKEYKAMVVEHCDD